MFRIEGLFIKLQSIKYTTTFKDKHGSKESTSTACVSTKLHMNFNRSFNKAVMKHFCKIPFEDFVNDGNLKFFMHIFSCTLKSISVQVVYTDTSVHTIFQGLYMNNFSLNRLFHSYCQMFKCFSLLLNVQMFFQPNFIF